MFPNHIEAEEQDVTPAGASVAEEALRLRYELAQLRKEHVRVLEEQRHLELREAYFRHLTEYSMDLITILDENGIIRFESHSVQAELGHPPEHYRGRCAFDFVHPEDLECVYAAFALALRDHGNTPILRFRFRLADGSYRILEGSGNNLLANAAVRGLVFNSRDITERLALQEQVERGRVDKEQTVAVLTGGVAHDFNNVLTAIQGLAELSLCRVGPQAQEARYLADILSNVERALLLTKQLVAFSRRMVLQPRAMGLAGWLKEKKPQLEEFAGPDVEVLVVTYDDAQVWIDVAQFEQVVNQMTVNAREAMPEGGRLTFQVLPIILEPEERPAGGQEGAMSYLQFTIADQGHGMNGETLGKIFDPYYTTKRVGHSGLGLCMCRGIIEQSGGHLQVSSSPGQGTTFHIYLPTKEGMEELHSPPLIVSQAPSTATILLVDDEPMLRELGETILSGEGYRVIVAEDGPSALQCLNELGDAKLDLLLTDVVMPGMTGVQLAMKVIKLRPSTRVLLCSGYTRDALDGTGGLPADVTFLSKPYNIAGLLGKVSELLGAASAEATG